MNPISQLCTNSTIQVQPPTQGSRLDLSSIGTVKQLIRSVQNFPHCTHLCLPAFIMDLDLKDILAHCPHLLHLDITACTQLTNRGILEALSHHCSKLKEMSPGFNVFEMLPDELLFSVIFYLDKASIVNLMRTYSPLRSRILFEMLARYINHRDKPLTSDHLEIIKSIASAISTKENIAPERKQFHGVTTLDLSECTFEEIDNFLKFFPNIRKLQLPPSITDEQLEHIVTSHCTQCHHLILDGCSKITNEGLKSITQTCKESKVLSLVNCLGLTGELDFSELKSLVSLSLNVCSGITTLPIFAKHCLLQRLSFLNCTGLTGELNFSHLPFLEALFLSGCTGLTIPPIFGKLRSLKILTFTGCTNLLRLPDLSELLSLEKLQSSFCPEIKTLPDFPEPSSLQELYLEHTGITMLPDLSKLRSLKILNVSKNPYLEKVPTFSGLTSLEALYMSYCTSITSLPSLSSLLSLKYFFLSGCTALHELPNLSELSSLEKFYLGTCTALTGTLDFSKLTALKELVLSHCTGLTTRPQFPSPSSLRRLAIKGCTGLIGVDLGPLPGVRVFGP